MNVVMAMIWITYARFSQLPLIDLLIQIENVLSNPLPLRLYIVYID